MLDLEFDSRQVERALGMKPSTLRLMADKVLPDGHGRRGVARKWSLADLTLLLVAQRFSDRGFIVPVAVAFARAVEEAELHRLIVDEDTAELYLVAWPDEAERHGWAFQLARSKSKEGEVNALDLLMDHRDSLVVDMMAMVREAMQMILDTPDASQQGGDVDV